MCWLIVLYFVVGSFSNFFTLNEGQDEVTLEDLLVCIGLSVTWPVFLVNFILRKFGKVVLWRKKK
jgi:hypothetical protein